MMNKQRTFDAKIFFHYVNIAIFATGSFFLNHRVVNYETSAAIYTSTEQLTTVYSIYVWQLFAMASFTKKNLPCSAGASSLLPLYTAILQNKQKSALAVSKALGIYSVL